MDRSDTEKTQSGGQEQLAKKLEEKERELNRREKRLRLLTILLLLLLIILFFGIWACVYQYNRGGLERETEAELGILPGMSEEELQDRLNRRVAESRLNVSINTEPVFEDGKSPGNIRIENIPGNHYSFTVTLTVTDASENEGAKDYIGQTVMTTGLIAPNSYVPEKSLDVNLPRGQYVCTATFKAYKVPEDDTDGEITEAGETGIQIILTVLNTAE